MFELNSTLQHNLTFLVVDDMLKYYLTNQIMFM